MEMEPKPPDGSLKRAGDNSIHPAWLALIRYCRELGHGELERLCIQDGVPVMAEHVRQKVKFKT
jgi:hypothetical protein